MKSRDKPLTSQVTGPEVVALALFMLGGGGRPVDTEDVAVRAHEIAPGRFSWRKYPDQINLELVRVALSDARKTDNGGLVTGTGKSGWSLTPEGQRWAEERGSHLLKQDISKNRAERRAGSIDEQRWQRERLRLMATEAWRQWSEGGAEVLSREAAADLFRIDRYVVGRALELKVNRLREMFGSDEELRGLVEAAASVVLKEE
jgi:hypothetical protein